MYKQCPECGQEYQHWVTACADCGGVALVLAGGETLGAAPDVEPRLSEQPPDDWELVKLGDPRTLDELARALQEHGITSWIAAHPRAGAQLTLGVHRADLDAARAIAEELMARSLPDLDGADVPEYDASSCPACGEPTPESAASCSECGLEFPEADPSSGQVLR